MQACGLKPVPLPYAPEPNWHAALERVSLLTQMPSQKSFGCRTKKQAYSVKKEKRASSYCGRDGRPFFCFQTPKLRQATKKPWAGTGFQGFLLSGGRRSFNAIASESACGGTTGTRTQIRPLGGASSIQLNYGPAIFLVKGKRILACSIRIRDEQDGACRARRKKADPWCRPCRNQFR